MTQQDPIQVPKGLEVLTEIAKRIPWERLKTASQVGNVAFDLLGVVMFFIFVVWSQSDSVFALICFLVWFGGAVWCFCRVFPKKAK